MSKTKATYRGTEKALYLIVQIVCDLAVKRLADFSKLKKKYTKEFFDAILQSLKAAEAMPNNSSRQGAQGDKRTTLETVNNNICHLFQTLLLYVDDGFDPSRQADMRKQAGSDFYEPAKGENWKDSKTLQEMAIQFMTTYAADLAKGDMPDEFAATFGTENEAFVAALLDFSTGKNTKSEETADKMAANNALYARLQSLMKDGRRIYAQAPALQKEFSYEAQRKLLGGDGKTGFRFSLKEEGTLAAIETASIEFLPTGNVFDEVSKKGVMLVHLPELKDKEPYSYLLTVPGYEEMAGTVVAHTGVMHRVNLILKRAAMSAMPEAVKRVS